MNRNLVILSLVALFAGCGGCGADQAAPRTPRCTVDPDAVAEKRECFTDETCPCGAHCELGECVASCSDDATCGDGNRCDEFGRCRSASDTSRIASLQTPGETPLSVTPPRVEVGDAGATIRLLGVKRDLGKTRVVAGPGVKLVCAEGAEPTPECRYEGVSASLPQDLRILADASVTGAAPGVVKVFSGSTVNTVSVTRSAALVAQPLSGQYTGSASLVGAGVGTEADPVSSFEAVILDLHANIFDDGSGNAVLEIKDDRRLLHPQGALIGALDPNAATLALPAFKFLERTEIHGAPVEVLARPTASAVTFDPTTATVTFEVRLRFEGILPGARAPQTVWRFTLSRKGDLPADATAPAVPASDLLSLDVNRSSQRIGWENAVYAALPQATGRPDSELADLARAMGGKAGWMDAYAVGDTVQLDAVENGATPWEWTRGSGQYRRADGSTALEPLVKLFQASAPAAVQNDPSHYEVKVTVGSAELMGYYIDLDTGTTFYGMACKVEPHAIATNFRTTTPGGSCLSALGGGVGNPIDVCDEMAAAYGCTPIDQNFYATWQGRIWFRSPQVEYRNTQNSCTYREQMADLDARVTRVCRFNYTPPADSALCYENKAGADHASVESAILTSAELDATGDLKCATGARSAALDIDGSSKPAFELLSACLEDLDRLKSAPPSGTGINGAGLSELFLPSSCIDPVRTLFAVGFLSRPMLTGEVPQHRRYTQLHRLLQQWVKVQAFVAREGLNAEELANVLRKGSLNTPNLPPALEQMLNRSVDGWGVMMHPRFADALFQLPDDVLARPDYRPDAVGMFDQRPHHDQDESISVAMLDAAQAQLEMTDLRLRRAALKSDLGIVPSASEVASFAQVAVAMSAGIHGRAEAWATAQGQQLSWKDRYDLALGGTTSALRRIIQREGDLLAGKNPLGIEENDLPLYFLDGQLGPGGRFSAISDYLLGVAPASTYNWAPTLVADANTALTAARDAWMAGQQRQLQRAMDQAALDQKLDQIRFDFGDRVAAYCSAPMTLGTAEILEKWEQGHGQPFSASDCFMVMNEPRCQVDLARYANQLKVEDVQYQLCMNAELKKALGNTVSVGSGDYAHIIENWDSCASLSNVLFPSSCGDGNPGCYACTVNGQTWKIDARTAVLPALRGPTVSAATLQAARTTCMVRWPTAVTTPPAPEDVGDDVSGCYRGSLGENVLTIRAAAKDVEIARSEMAELQESYDVAMKSCIIREESNDKIEQLTDDHNRVMTALRVTKMAMDDAAIAAGALKDCAQTIKDDLTFGAASALGCGAAAYEASFEIASNALQVGMDEAQQQYETQVMKVQNEADVKVCMNDAEMNLIGMRTAALKVERAMQDLQLAMYNFNEGKIAADTYFADGQAALAATRGRFVTPMAHDYWVGEKIRIFMRKMALARRVTYLAVRAVEYEFQMSSMARAQVLQAETPDELAAVISQVQAASGTRGFGANRPSDLKVVVSLRKHVMQLADKSGLPPTQQPLTDVERFRMLLSEPRNAVFDANGTWLGQRIPFTLAPLGAMGLGDPMAIPIYAQNSCAERLWRVNADVVGTDLFHGDDAAFVQMDLLKANTFYSQWCDATGKTSGFQTVSIRPSRNLFRDGSETAGAIPLGVEQGTNVESRARMQPFFNVPRDEFSADTYSNGSTTELAARGVYGEYALFLPANMLSTVDARGNPSTGLKLNQVDDILLRLDYVSVAR